MVFRFGNGLFEPIWNRNYIDHVQITVAEAEVEARGAYYDTAGAMRDMVPNHIAQLVSLVGMEPPISFSADAVRRRAGEADEVRCPLTPEGAARGGAREVRPGELEEGCPATGRRRACRPTAAPHLRRPPADDRQLALGGRALLRRTGKRLPRRITGSSSSSSRLAMLFQHTSVEHLTTNRLFIHISPRRGSPALRGQVPGPVLTMGAVEMDFDYSDYFGKVPAPATRRCSTTR